MRISNVAITKELPTVLSFCSGYGGIERGLDLAGFKHRVIAYVEIEAFAIANLLSKMERGQLEPAPIYTNLKTFPAYLFRDKVSLITGGYPCQPFSSSGNRKGKDDPRHLWPFIRKHMQAIKPRQCFFENVEGHISLGLSSVISDMEEDGYGATWGLFSAREVFAEHQRKRVFILADTYGTHGRGRRLPDRMDKEYTYVDSGGHEKGRTASQQWLPEPSVGRVVDGCPDRVDRLRMLGNGVVPQTAAKAWQKLNAHEDF
jgi:site-specific DNA-cytosine methylase